MDCPQCKGYHLEPYEIEAGLVACRCPKCEGSLLPLMSYRYWIDHNPDISFENTEKLIVEDSGQAKLCPKCSKLMTKYKIGTDPENKIELCSSCDEAWLDAGEWQLLKSLDIHDKLPSIFTDAWQRNIRVKQQETSLKSHYKNQLGEEAFSRVDEFKQWLDGQSEKGDIVQYLTTKIQ